MDSVISLSYLKYIITRDKLMNYKGKKMNKGQGVYIHMLLQKINLEGVCLTINVNADQHLPY